MKRLLLLSALAALSAFAGNITQYMSQDPGGVAPTSLSFSLPTGETVVDMKYPFGIGYLEGAFVEANKSLKIQRVRTIGSIPYVAGFSSDPASTDGVVTDRSTFSNVNEAFRVPVSTNGAPNGMTELVPVSSSGTGSLVFSKLPLIEGTDYTYYPSVTYSYATNSLTAFGRTEVIGPPAEFTYVQHVTWYGQDPYDGDVLFRKVVTSGPETENTVVSADSLVVTNSLVEYEASANIQQKWEDWGFDDGYECSFAKSNLLVLITTRLTDYAATNSVDRYLPGTEYPFDGTAASYVTVPCTNSFVLSESWTSKSVVTNFTKVYGAAVPGMNSNGGDVFVMNTTEYDGYSMTDSVTTRVVDGIETYELGRLDQKNRYSSVLFAGKDIPFDFVPGHVVTNFALWSTCELTVTNVVLDITVPGRTFSTNLTDTVFFPKDRIVVSGTAMPTGYIIGIGKK